MAIGAGDSLLVVETDTGNITRLDQGPHGDTKSTLATIPGAVDVATNAAARRACSREAAAGGRRSAAERGERLARLCAGSRRDGFGVAPARS